MASSAQNLYSATAAPPPTPSTKSNLSTSASADALSRLLHRLPPTLSLPMRRFPLIPTVSPPTISSLNDVALSSLQLGFFQLIDHGIAPQIAHLAEEESVSLFQLSRDEKERYFPKHWPLGFNEDDEEEDEYKGQSLCLNSSCSTESTELSLTSLLEFTRAMEKLGLKIVESLSCAVGFENPFIGDLTNYRSLMWIREGCRHGDKPEFPSGLYPYIAALQYQIRCQKCWILADSGWVSSSPQVDSVLVTLGDIAEVWSNGKLKKVIGIPVSSSTEANNSTCISMSLLITLPIQSQIQIHHLLIKPNQEHEQHHNGSKSTTFAMEGSP